jgi:Flp pilus assembly protein TadD
MTPQESSVTGIGIEQFKSGNYNEAANFFNQALQINQNNAVALTAKGLLAAAYNKDFK